MALLEARVPISPTPTFFARTRLLAASLREFYPDTIVKAYIGQSGGATPALMAMARNELPMNGPCRVDCIEWIDGPEFDIWMSTTSPYLATMNRRFVPDACADVVAIFDADVVCVGSFDDLFEVAAVQGVQAHVPSLPNSVWESLFHQFGAPTQDFGFRYGGAGIMCPSDATGPWYVNSGFVLAPRPLFERLCKPYQEAIGFLRERYSDTYWFDQWALALAAAKAEVPIRSLSPRYNFPNQHGFDVAYPDDLTDVRFLHYLRLDTVHRDRDFASWDAACQFVRRCDLSGSNEVLRQSTKKLMAIVWPEQAANAETVAPRHA